MKHEIRWNFLTGTALAWMLSASAVGCMVTAFQPEVENFLRLLLFFAAVAVFSGVCFSLRGGDVVLVGILALTAGYLWHEGTVWAHIAALLRHISRLYDMAYGWGEVTLGGYNGLGSVDLALGIIGSLSAISVSWVTVRRKSVLCALPMTVLPLVSCLIVTDTVPRHVWLYLLMLGLILLLLTDYIRRREKTHVAALTAYLALPAAAALGLLFLLVPQESYVNRAGEFEERFIAWASGFVEPEEEPVSGPVSDGVGHVGDPELDLTDIGPKTAWNYTVLEVLASETGTYYLRGQDYDTYSGTGWVASPRLEQFGGGAPVGEITVRSRGTADLLYLPYYPARAAVLTDGGHGNSQRLTRYTFELTDAPRYSDGAEANRYLELPQSTALWAEPLVSRILAEKPLGTADAQAVADYVRACARYDLETPRMPDTAADFARWFLEESDSGYCVHFATSTVVLLRAAGIPARYVTGYTARCTAGETAMVPEKAAHAWAEYHDGSRWQVLESTPAHEDNTVSPETEPVTEPPETQTESVPATQAATQSPQTRPTQPEMTGPEPPPEAQKPMNARAKGLLAGALILAVAVGQSLLRASLDRRRWNRGKPNRRALERWAQVCRIARLLGQRAPEDLEELAEKARFSQHTLTERELTQFRLRYRQMQSGLRQRPLWQRLYWFFIFAVW